MPKIVPPRLLEPLHDLKLPTKGSDFYAQCSVGHTEHNKIVVDMDLDGQYRGIADVPPVPKHLAQHFKMEVYAWRDYFNVVDEVPINKYETYCPAQDIISYSLDVAGTWEAFEVLLTLDLLKDGNKEDICLDFGSQVGIYSMLCAVNGYRVAAFDALAENIQVLKDNAKLNKVNFKVFPYLTWIDNTIPKLPADAEPVHLAKMDVEGYEADCVAMIEPLLQAQKVNYVLIEVSPVFNDTYPELIDRMISYGYEAYQIPGKGWEHSDEFGRQPLATLKKYCRLPDATIREYVATLRQENFLMIRSGL